jgi:8-hydroxy-5-deazaflavin:NADPH oxidoreductase
MRIAVLGTGNVGGTLGQRWAAKGHEVVFGSRDPDDDRVRRLLTAAGANAEAAGYEEASNSADVTVLATPWEAAQEVLESIGNWAGRILIDCTNPIAPDLQLAVGTTSSAAEIIAEWTLGAHVVKAFNTTGWNNMADPIYQGEPITMFICGDNAEAKAIVTALAEDLDFDVVDAGALYIARYLEPLAMLWINLATVQRLGRNIAFKLVRR